MADWRNADDYAYTASLTLEQWAWEFLRRGTAYRELWAKHQREEFISNKILASMNPEQWHKRAPDGTLAGRPYFGSFPQASALGLNGPMIDPALKGDEAEAAGLRLRWDSGVRIVNAWQASKLAEQLPHTSMLVVFDLRRSIREQAREAERTLTAMQQIAAKQIPRIRPQRLKVERGRWVLYLRLLDAREAKVSLGEIGKALFGPATRRRVGNPKNSAQNALRKARAMVNGGYRDLVRPRGHKKQRG